MAKLRGEKEWCQWFVALGEGVGWFDWGLCVEGLKAMQKGKNVLLLFGQKINITHLLKVKTVFS